MSTIKHIAAVRVADWYAAAQRRDWCPEEALVGAIIECAVRDLGTPVDSDVHRGAWAWVFGDEEPTHPFTFLKCCAIVGIDPDAFRERVQRHRHGILRRGYVRDRRVA